MKKDKGKKGFWGEFREFALKGSVVDLAVGIIIGGAFQSIVNSLVKDVVMPFVGLLTGGLDFTSRFLILKPAPDGVDAAKLGDIAYVRDTLNLPVFAYGSFLTARSEHGDALEADGYEMHFDLPPGHYQYLVSAFQRDYDEIMPAAARNSGATFIRTEPLVGDSLSAVTHTLTHRESGYVPNAGLPLDTLWHGMQTDPVEVKLDQITRDTVSLMRNMKEISVVLREVDDPTRIDVDDYRFRIYSRNALLLWDNSVDESADADTLIYTPYATRNTEDRPVEGVNGVGRMAHADFMTSRLIYHDSPEEDAVLSITNRRTGVEVVRVDLPDILSRLRTAADIYRYTPQEFLDRGYDFQLTFFLRGDTWEYVNVEISALSWAKRIQYETIGL